MTDIYTREGIVKTYYDGKIITVIWEVLFNKKVLYEGCEAQLRIVNEQQIEVIIIDISNAKGTPPLEVQNWFGEVLFPGFKAVSSFKGLINVLPASVITKMGAKHWKKTAQSDEFGFHVYESDSLDAANKLALEMMQQ